MSRVGRVVVPGFPHHVTQRGNRRSDVFVTDTDREAYLALLGKYASRYGLSVWAYCLMSNHIHLIVVPEREESLGLALRDAHTVYALRFNSRTGLSGHVWQGRFYSSPLDDAHLWAATRYIEQNPVRAGMIERAEAYEWSSAAAHCGLRRDPLLASDFPPPGVIDNWSEWLSITENDTIITAIRQNTHTGRPCGPPAFIDRLQDLLQRTLRPKKRGRKPKRKDADATPQGNS
ncbi:MAG TPA: transposase [Candidatus Hydrogenedentes bacterium]|nr:transposase [Candidatus Hydrogenedentota bacterium]